MSNIKDFIKSNNLPRLAVDLDFIAGGVTNSATCDPSIGGTASPQTLLSLTGKFAIELLHFDSIATAEDTRIVLIIDGVTVWDNTSTHTTPMDAIGVQAINNTNTYILSSAGIMCETSFVLKVGNATYSTATIAYSVKAIL